MNLPPAYNIRPLTLADLNAVLAIDALSFPTPAKRQLFAYELEENKLAHYVGLTAVTTLIGYSGYWLMGDEVHISTIAVHPKWRRKGLGELLLLNLLLSAYQHPATMVTLEVREHNIAAQKLYQKVQFDIVGKRPCYYRDTGEDALLMTRAPLDAPYHNFLHRQLDVVLNALVE